MQTLKEFYRRTRPWGFWGVVHRELQRDYPELEPNRDLTKDLFNVLIGVVWQTAIAAFAVLLVLQQWTSLCVVLLVIAATSVTLKYTWMDRMQNDPDESKKLEMSQWNHANNPFEFRKLQLVQQFETLSQESNKPLASTHGIFERWENPVVTPAHIPLDWRFDFCPERNPFLLERIRMNATFNSGAIFHDGKYKLVVRVEAVDRKIILRNCRE